MGNNKDKGGAGKRWTENELKYLERFWAQLPSSVIAKSLNRTLRAVQSQAARLELGRRTEYDDNINLSIFLRTLLNRNSKPSVHDYKRYFASGAPYLKLTNTKRSCYLVNIDKFWQWAEKHRETFDLTKIEPLVFGKEPKWLSEYRRTKGAELATERWKEHISA